MDNASRVLFDSYPRTVGVAHAGGLTQFFVRSEGEFDAVFDKVRDKADFYSSICRFRADMRPVTGNVAFDFDSPMKEAAFSEDVKETEKIERMRESEELCNEVLGDVWEDVQSLIEKCKEDGVPVISVFSGMGVHCHLLFKERVDPVEEKVTTSRYYIDECDLDTWDRKILPDTRRVLRVPNSQRFDGEEATGLWNIPMTETEVLSNDVYEVLQRSSSPKDIGSPGRYMEENRPKLEKKEGYENVEEEVAGSVEISEGSISDDTPPDVEYILENHLPMPCLRERFKGTNPSHFTRLAGVIMLYNTGHSPSEVFRVIQNLNWIDFDPNITKKMLKQIYERGYSDPSCQTLRNKGLCVYNSTMDEYEGEPENCETFGWSNGACEWKK